MTLTKITKTQAKKLINENFSAIIKVLPSNANPNSPWFAGSGHEFHTVEELEEAINGTLYYQCNAELGRRVAYWVDLENKTEFPIDYTIPVWKVTRNDGDVFYCMVKDFANYINTDKNKIVEGYVCTPTLSWTVDQIIEGKANNFYFMDGKYESQKFIKMAHKD